jgi:alpha-tubulin suppressor-like RCC1 family protein
MSVSNVLFIDSSITDYNIFVSSVNASTVPLVYSSSTTRAEILATLSEYTSIDRIGIAFSNSTNVLFLEGETFFNDPLEPFSNNTNFIISLIQQWNVKHIDYLACRTLNNPEWANYYATITEQTGVIVGASEDNTGNILYGGDWVLESTGQDIEMIYFTQNIEYYTYLLDSISNYNVMIKQDNTIQFTGDNNASLNGFVYTSDRNTLQFVVGLSGLTPTLIACGNEHVVVLMNNGVLYSWGRNTEGQLNLPVLINRDRAALFSNPTGLTPIAIQCGNNATYILMNDVSGSIYCCGQNNSGQLGLGNFTSPISTLQQLVNTTGKIPKSIHAGLTHLIVLMTDDTIYGTGANGNGQLGIALNNTTTQYTLQPMQIPSGKTVKKVAPGNVHTLVLMTDNTIYGTGRNNAGQLGLGNFNNQTVLTQMTNSTGKTPLSIYSATSSFSTYVLMTDNTIYGTGGNGAGQLGLGNLTNQNTLQLMTNSTGKIPTSIYASGRYVLVKMDDNTIYGAGENNFGMLALGFNSTNQTTIALMQNTTGQTVNQFISGDRVTVLLMNNGSIYTAGLNTTGALGLGHSRYYYSYTQVVNLNITPVTIEYGSQHIIILSTTGDIYGIGLNTSGQLGIANTTNQTAYQIMQNTTSKTPIGIACGAAHTIVSMSDGTIYGTGGNGLGELGLGNAVTPRNTLQLMTNSTGKTPKEISCGTNHTIVLMTDASGLIYGTGYNNLGQLGLGNVTTSFTSLQLMQNTTGKIPKDIACGSYTTIVLMTDGTIYGTGLNANGQLGLGNITSPQTTLQLMTIPIGKTPTMIACGSDHTIVLMTDGTLYSTGLNTNGQLGIGNTTTPQNTLQLMTNSSGKTPVAIHGSSSYTIVLMSDGSIYGTGLNSTGQLGLGFFTQFTTLQEITTISSVRRLPSSNIYLNSPNIQMICFKRDTQILTDKGYIPIQYLRVGDLVKTVSNGFVPIHMLGKRDMYHVAAKNRINDQLYVCTSDAYPEVFEPLVLTGCHSVLVKAFTSEKERNRTIEVNGNTYVTDRHYRLPVCVDERAKVYEKRGIHTIYHMSLENDDYYMNYGIYANGLLVETCSKRFLKELSNMEIL